MGKKETINVQGTEIILLSQNKEDIVHTKSTTCRTQQGGDYANALVSGK
jgi:hypothetical protein